MKKITFGENSRKAYVECLKLMIEALGKDATKEDMVNFIFRTTPMMVGSEQEREQLNHLGELMMDVDGNADEFMNILEDRMLQYYEMTLKTMGDCLTGIRATKEQLEEVLSGIDDEDLKEVMASNIRIQMGFNTEDDDLLFNIAKESIRVGIYMLDDAIAWAEANGYIKKLDEAAVDIEE